MSKATKTTPTVPTVPQFGDNATNGEKLAALTLSACNAVARFNAAKRDQSKAIRNADAATIGEASSRMVAAMADTRDAAEVIRNTHKGDRTPNTDTLPPDLRERTGELIASALLFSVGADNAATGDAKELAKILRKIG